MPELTWLGKDAIRHHHLEVPFRPFVPTAEYTAPATPPDAPRHRIIHGDNLDALKSLLPEYAGRVKCIYIDPPYNTGNEGWAYNDNVSDPRLTAWLHKTVGKETEDLTRHDKWLCMMYPRLHLLHKLLADDGAIFISIDDNEVAHLRCVMDEVFGRSNFITEFVWRRRSSSQLASNKVSVDHEYVVTYVKNKESGFTSFNGIKKDFVNYKNPDNDPRGAWTLGDLTVGMTSEQRPNQYYDLVDPATGIAYPASRKRVWTYIPDSMDTKIKEGRIAFPKNGKGRPMLKRYAQDLKDDINPISSLLEGVGLNSEGTRVLQNIFGEKNFNYPKPISLIEQLLEQATTPDSIILDSFAGSGTTLHAVAKLNARDGGRRQCLLVEVEDYADTLTAERARRVLGGYGTVPGLGGQFEFGTLGAPLFDAATGLLDPAAPLAALRQYVWWQETGTRLPPPAAAPAPDHAAFLGTAPDGSRVYFDYDPAQATVLDARWLAQLTVPAPRYVVYADSCEVSEDWLAMYDVVYKKIPRDLARL